MRFEPIAVVGQSCILPDALNARDFWRNIEASRVSLSQVADERWRLPRSRVMGTPADWTDRTWTDQGGYVRGFGSIFDPDGFQVEPERISRLDPVFQWVLHGAREALRDSGHDGPQPRTGLVLGNLSFPSAAMARYAEQVWRGAGPDARPDPWNRFCSGLPAHIAAKALGLGAGAYALDAACASSLYAVKLACDRLQDGTADLMLAGAVNCADDLFIHLGFCALSAMSRTGRSRPFDQGADGLVPGEGAAFTALMRLEDAVAQGREILGVIRGVGLSNDGSDGGLLTPSEDGQVRAMRLAYESAGIDPRSVSLLECHATGTQVGDAVEIRAMSRVFDGADGLPVGSVKSNFGHPVTAAGLAGLLKVLGAMRAGIRPATVGVEEPTSALDGTGLRLLTENEPWDGPRRAAISAFGFGGNNAHLIVDAWEGTDVRPAHPNQFSGRAAANTGDPVVIVAIGARVGSGADRHDLTRALLDGTGSIDPPSSGPRTTVDVDIDGLRFPPRDLERAHAQQLLILAAAREAVRDTAVPKERTVVLVGMGCDPEVARYHARWRAATWDGDGDAYAPSLDAPGVLGTMPNVVANRLNAQLDLSGPGFSVSAEEGSGLVALGLAARALRRGEADSAIVGAVDLSHEPVHQAALAELGIDRTSGDAAVALVLKRLTDARRDGDTVLAHLDELGDEPADMVVGTRREGSVLPGFDPEALFGTAHAATGLVAVAAAALALHHRAVPDDSGRRAAPGLGIRSAEVIVAPLEAPSAEVRLHADDTPAAWLGGPAPRLHVYSGQDLADVLAAADVGRESDAGSARLVIAAAGAAELAERSTAARRWLTGQGIRPDGVAFRERPLDGTVAFVYTNGSAAYPGMGRELMFAFPEITAELEVRCGPLEGLVGWAYRRPADGFRPRHPLNQMWGAALLAQLHTEITRGVLGIEPTAVFGHSSGELASLVSMRAWRDVRSLVIDLNTSDVFTHGVVGDLDAIRSAWAKSGIRGDRWASYIVTAPLDQIREALTGNPAMHLMAANAPDVSVVGGEESECERVLAEHPAWGAIRLDYEIAAHAPELEEVREEWWRLHCRTTDEVPGVRFYGGASGEPYALTQEAVADALTAQAVGAVNFDTMVERAYADGARIFIEHGPRGLCSDWIERVLGDREHLAVPLDSSEGHGIRRLIRSGAELVAAGVPLRSTGLFDHVAHVKTGRNSTGAVLTVPAHPPAVQVKPVPAHSDRALSVDGSVATGAAAGLDPAYADAEEMAPAPWLPPVSTPAAMPAEPAPEPGCEPTSPPATEPTPALATAADGETPAAAGTRTELVVEATAAHQRGLTSALQEFLTQQTTVHHDFLAIRQRAQIALLRGPAAALPGPTFDRAELEHLAGGRVSELFGPAFAVQDSRERQTRMPQPPMLLTDRVTGIDAIPASMGTGTIWTETDVRLDGWYLDPAGRMPAGITVESGQADLLLISWLGADVLDDTDGRVYRLLGCDLSFHGGLPQPGETLRFEIHIDGHGEHEGTRLFFFHYDCYAGDELRLSVRNGQAGFFSEAELADTGGVLWGPAEHAPDVTAPLALPESPAYTARRTFDADQVRAFADGRPAECFGPEWNATRAHVRTPRISTGRMLLLGEVPDVDPTGGPWQRGYLRAETAISPDDWFFAGHFKNDPCMPGTLMLEGCLQATAFYLGALGFTTDRDGWRFEPASDTASRMVCRGQVTPQSRLLTYEVFVRALSDADGPLVVADVLCTVDGVKAFLASELSLRLVRDWPLEHWRRLGPPALQETGEPVALASLGGLVGQHDTADITYGYPAVLASAWGRPSEAFSGMYGPAEDTGTVPRLPGPPYLFISRIVSVDGPPGELQAGVAVVAEYDVGAKSWYFEQNGGETMPFAVLMEIALQPCGWLASYVGCARGSTTDLLFRNLDGTATIDGVVGPDTARVRTRAELREISQLGDMIIVSFDVTVTADDTPVFRTSTVFGFFPPEAFADQAGLPCTDAERHRLTEPGDRTLALPTGQVGPMLLMLDRVTGYWPDGGAAGLGRLRGEKDVDGDEWFFKAHFFQDPVQPGSLGVEAMYQLLQAYLNETGAADSIQHPRFEPVSPTSPVSWRYRGQVVPANACVTVELEISETGTDERGRYAMAVAWLWVDGKRIYHVRDLGMRVVESSAPDSGAAGTEIVLSAATDTWLHDHRPTWTIPTLPAMSTLDLLARAARAHTGRPVTAMRDVQLHRWVRVADAAQLKTEVAAVDGAGGAELTVTLLMWRAARTAALSRYEPVATGTVHVGEPVADAPAPFGQLSDAVSADDPYAAGELFHGPAFQFLVSVREGTGGASGVLDAGRGTVPRGLLHQGLLDAALHVIPHDQLCRWSAEIDADMAAFPYRIAAFDSYAPLPDTGEVQVEARFAGFDAEDRRLPAFDVQLSADGRLFAAYRLVEILVPKGRIAMADPVLRRTFLRDRRYAGGIGLSVTQDAVTYLSADDVDRFDWLVGTVAEVYGLPTGVRGRDHLAEIAVRDHVGRHVGVHPAEVAVADDLARAWPADRPHETLQLDVAQQGEQVTVRSQPVSRRNR